MYFPKLDICTYRSYYFVLPSLSMLYFIRDSYFLIQNYEGPRTPLNRISLLLVINGVHFPKLHFSTSWSNGFVLLIKIL
jgi:hypothetical protein